MVQVEPLIKKKTTNKKIPIRFRGSFQAKVKVLYRSSAHIACLHTNKTSVVLVVCILNTQQHHSCVAGEPILKMKRIVCRSQIHESAAYYLLLML